MFVFTPLPAFFFWPAVLLPSLMAAFLAEGSKFLFFDTSICRNPVWYPSGEDSPPRVADDCTLGTTGIFSIVAGTVFFLCLILVCLKAPEKRTLREDYGQRHYDDNNRVENDAVVGTGHSEEVGSYDDRGSADNIFYDEEAEEPGELPKFKNFDYGSYGEDGFIEVESQTSKPTNFDDEDLVSARLKTLDPQEDKYLSKPTDDNESPMKDRYDPTKPASKRTGDRINPDVTVSKSRLSAKERLELNTAAQSGDELIHKFVNDLNLSFQAESGEEKEANNSSSKDDPGFFQNLCGTTATACDTPHTAQSF